MLSLNIMFIEYSVMFVRCSGGAASDNGTLISSALFPDNQLWQVFLSSTSYEVSVIIVCTPPSFLLGDGASNQIFKKGGAWQDLNF